MGGEYIEFDWNLPIQIFVGFLNKKLPIISSIYLDYKLSSQNNWNTFTTINLNSSNITKIRIYPISHTQNLISISDTFVHLYNFNKELYMILEYILKMKIVFVLINIFILIH